MVDVKPQIPFGKVSETGPANSQNARIQELESYQTDPVLSFVNVELTTGWHEGLKQLLRDGEIRQNQIAPTGSEEWPAFGRMIGNHGLIH